jgi:hypothetical protein
MLMFWLLFSPYRMFTWQYETFDPLAGTIALFADLMPGVCVSPGASSEQSGTPAAKAAGANRATPARLAVIRESRLDLQRIELPPRWLRVDQIELMVDVLPDMRLVGSCRRALKPQNAQWA